MVVCWWALLGRSGAGEGNGAGTGAEAEATQGVSVWTVGMGLSAWDRRLRSVVRLLVNFRARRYVVDAIREVGAKST